VSGCRQGRALLSRCSRQSDTRCRASCRAAPLQATASAQNASASTPAVSKCVASAAFTANSDFCCALRAWATRRNQNQ
jgi:hypothetical protein